MIQPTLYQKLQDWLDPGILMLFAIYYFVECFYHSATRSPEDFFNGRYKQKAFAKFWTAVSPPAQASDVPEPMDGAFATLPELLASANGKVLEVGPGSGRLMKYLDQSKIEHISAVEPAVDMHAALQQSATAAGFKESFTILPCGAEPQELYPQLEKVYGSSTRDLQFDTIISIRSLCSVTRPRETIPALYRLLRPGGRILICEHVVNPWRDRNGSPVARLLQVIYTWVGWPFFIGGCRLTRDTISILEEAARVDGGWEKIDLRREKQWSPLPWVLGSLTKRT